jgi:hypothetical protein
MSLRGEALVDCLAADIGRLRRRVCNDVYAVLLVERIASSVEIVDALLGPTAADLYREYFTYSLDDEVAVECALEDVDRREQHLRRLLGVKAAA